MKCYEFTEILAEYWDLPDNDIRKVSANRHLSTCLACSDEYEIWKTSTDLIQFSRETDQPVDLYKPIATNVMSRIYNDESWRLPVTLRSYTFSYKVRRNIMATFALFMAVFLVTFISSLTGGSDLSTDFNDMTGIIDTAHADELNIDADPTMFDGMPVASISAPTILRMGPIQTYTDYLLALSILGFVFTLLIMNWLSRIRA
ncbi:MAG: zf-HC2 domain-containing protein [Paenibacillaceae bacterium]